MLKKIYPYLGLVILLNTSCSKDNTQKIFKPVTPLSSYDVLKDNEKVVKVIGSKTSTNNFIIDVKDINGKSLQNAEISIGNKTAVTETSGIVSLNNVTTLTKHTVVKVKKDGYITSLRTVLPKEEKVFIKIILLEKKSPIELNAKIGGKISKDNVELLFPEKSLVDEDGLVFEGKASVNIVNYSPKDERFYQIFPGNLTGISSDNQEVGLASAGMLTVKITDDTGKKLQIGKNKKVHVTMPTSENAPNTIPLWHLNEKYGLWVEMGIAKKKDKTYNFEVNHFSSYNLDLKIENPIEFCLTVEDSEKNIFKNTDIGVEYKNSLGNSVKTIATTDDNGKICFINAEKGKYNFFIYSACGDLLSNKQSISIKEDKDYKITLTRNDIKDKTINKTFNLTGFIKDCNNKPLPDTQHHSVYVAYDKDFYLPLGTWVGSHGLEFSPGKINRTWIKKTCEASGYLKISPYIINTQIGKIYKTTDYIADLSSPKTEDIKLNTIDCLQESNLVFDDYFELEKVDIAGTKPYTYSVVVKQKQRAIDENIYIVNFNSIGVRTDKGGSCREIYRQKNASLGNLITFSEYPYSAPPKYPSSLSKVFYIIVQTNKGVFMKKFSVK